jgi:predicted DNA-binding transcriptional regulator AlpA
MLNILIREQRFPQPIRITPKRLAFNSTEVEEWMQERLTNGPA